MLYKLSQGEKNVVDTALGIVGALFGTGGFYLAHLPTALVPFGTAIGIAVGYFVSDAVAYIDTGTLPSGSDAAKQAYAAYQAAKPGIIAQIKQDVPDPGQQTIALGVLDTVEAELNKKLAQQ